MASKISITGVCLLLAMAVPSATAAPPEDPCDITVEEIISISIKTPNPSRVVDDVCELAEGTVCIVLSAAKGLVDALTKSVPTGGNDVRKIAVPVPFSPEHLSRPTENPGGSIPNPATDWSVLVVTFGSSTSADDCL